MGRTCTNPGRKSIPPWESGNFTFDRPVQTALSCVRSTITRYSGVRLMAKALDGIAGLTFEAPRRAVHRVAPLAARAQCGEEDARHRLERAGPKRRADAVGVAPVVSRAALIRSGNAVTEPASAVLRAVLKVSAPVGRCARITRFATVRHRLAALDAPIAARRRRTVDDIRARRSGAAE